ncbi:unnamed protein product, partial [Mesorhabditis belari]|uniref:C-type lectin domain-containing protein n=1 Tax=Mesorhabditis belari TaxID=2138241 RepID=A0AAF3FIF3_9BILA
MQNCLVIFHVFLTFGKLVGITVCPKSDIASSFEGSYYFGIKNLNDSYNDADATCQDFGGHSTSIHNGFVNANLLQLARVFYESAETVWLGGGAYEGNTITWLDGSPDDYHNFKPDN